MESVAISAHQVRIYEVLRQQDGEWITSEQLALKAVVAWRTARAHCLNLVRLGLVEKSEVVPAHYRLSHSRFSKKQNAYFQRLNAAREVLQNP